MPNAPFFNDGVWIENRITIKEKRRQNSIDFIDNFVSPQKWIAPKYIPYQILAKRADKKKTFVMYEKIAYNCVVIANLTIPHESQWIVLIFMAKYREERSFFALHS